MRMQFKNMDIQHAMSRKEGIVISTSKQIAKFDEISVNQCL